MFSFYWLEGNALKLSQELVVIRFGTKARKFSSKIVLEIENMSEAEARGRFADGLKTTPTALLKLALPL